MERGKREAKSPDNNMKNGKKKAILAACIALALVILGYGVLSVLAITSDTVYPNVDVAGVAVGGMTQADAEAVLDGQLEEVYDTTGVELKLDGAVAATITLNELGVDADAAAAAEQAYQYGRSGSKLFWGLDYFKCLVAGASVMPCTEADDSAVTKAVNAACDELDIVIPEEYFRVDEADPDHIYFTKPCDGRTLDRETLKEAVKATLESGVLTPVDCAYTSTPAPKMDLQEIHARLSAQMQNASYDKATGEIIPHVLGVEFSVEDAEKALAGAADGEEVAVAASVNHPEVTAEDLKANLFRDVLGTCTTNVSGTANRKSNVRRAAGSINSLILLPGEVFSYNGALGKRTAANGYLPAPAYVAGETVDEIGGGICQVSSTLYYACLKSNLNIVERWAHRFAPSYIPLGMDATVSWGGPDYKFENDTAYPIRLDVSWQGSKLTVTVKGTNVTGNYATMTYVTLSTTPWETVYEEDPAMAPGTQEVKTTAYTGIKVQSYQHHYDKNGNLIKTEFEATSDYKVRNKVILVAPGEDPTKAPADKPVTPPATEDGSGSNLDDPSSGPADGGSAEPVTPPVEGEEGGGETTEPVTPPAEGEGSENTEEIPAA